MPDQIVVGKVGRVSGPIGPGKLGEVIIPVRGGAEAYLARAASANTTIAVGTQVTVEKYFPPRTVVVSPLE